MMNEARFEELAAAYGATLTRWPDDQRAEAEILLASSDKARDILEQERILDATLNALDVPQPSDALMARILGDAAEVSLGHAPEAASTTAGAVAAQPGFLSRIFGDWGWRPAGAMTACLAIGFIAGLSGAPTPMDTDTDYAASQMDFSLDSDIAFLDDYESDLFDLETL